MKRHIIGLTIFTFIVGAAAIAHAIFNIHEIIQVSAVPQNEEPSKPTACWNMRRKIGESNFASPTVSQAIYNLQTKKLSWKCGSSNVEAFHIWVRDEKGARYLHSFFTENCSRGVGATEIHFESLNPNKLSSQANLYLIPDRTIENAAQLKTFEIDKAIPVTIDFGK